MKKLLSIFTIIFLISCVRNTEQSEALNADNTSEIHSQQLFTNYLDIPDIFYMHLDATTELINKSSYFVYGIFINFEQDKEIALIICHYLTYLFGIEFKPELLDRNDFIYNGNIDFSGDLNWTLENSRNYFMTLPMNYLVINQLGLMGMDEERLTEIFDRPVFLSTPNPELVPILDIIQRAIEIVENIDVYELIDPSRALELLSDEAKERLLEHGNLGW